ncbi:MAG: hypothetical protein KF764_28080 [Labilithrix sp.]|nr:hypothetical protein [Labilithrix sp.]
MSDEELEPTEPSLGALFRDERQRGVAPAGSKDRVFGRLAISLAGPTGGGSAGGAAGEGRTPDGSEGAAPGGGAAIGHGGAATTSRLLPLLGTFLAGGLAGGIAVAKLAPPRVVVVERPVEGSARPEVPLTPAFAPSLAVPSGTSANDATRERLTPPAASVEPIRDAAARESALARERALLDVARTALGRGDGAHALAFVNRHASEFPRGQMTEEREALAVQALTKLGRKPEAVQRGLDFHKTYPSSVLGPVVDAALENARASDVTHAPDGGR